MGLAIHGIGILGRVTTGDERDLRELFARRAVLVEVPLGEERALAHVSDAVRLRQRLVAAAMVRVGRRFTLDGVGGDRRALLTDLIGGFPN